MTRQRYWRREGDVLRDHIVCPRCGEGAPNRKPSRGNHGGLRCDCPSNGQCFADEGNGLVWRRSPCSRAACSCGWTGVMSSRDFEQRYGASRCPVAGNGVHDVLVQVYENTKPGALTIRLRCRQCGAQGHVTIDPIDGVAWEYGTKE